MNILTHWRDTVTITVGLLLGLAWGCLLLGGIAAGMIIDLAQRPVGRARSTPARRTEPQFVAEDA